MEKFCISVDISIPHGTIKTADRHRQGEAEADFNSTWYD